MKVIAFIIMTIAFTAGCGERGWSKSEVAESKSNGNIIVASLKAYYCDNQHYPVQLEELIPKYLTKIPPPIRSKPWEYRIMPNGHGFNLSFTGGKDGIESYNYSLRKDLWEYDSGTF